MPEHKTMLITGSKLTNYASFLFLAPEMGGGLLVLLKNLLHWLISLGSGTGRFSEAVQAEMEIKAQGPCSNAKRFPWQGPWGGQTGEHK